MPIVSPWIFYLINLLSNIDTLCSMLAFLSFLVLLGLIFIPTEETMYQMLVANYVTDKNIETATDVIKDSVDYIFEKIEEGEE